MKYITLLIAALFTVLGMSAQTNDEEIDLIQSVYGLEKKAIVKEFVNPKPENIDAFWGVYEKYEIERKVLGKERIKLLEQFSTKYETMSNQESALWMKRMFALDNNQDNLLEGYYKKVSKVTSPLVAMRFYQVENFLLTAMRYQILNEMPFVEDK